MRSDDDTGFFGIPKQILYVAAVLVIAALIYFVPPKRSAPPEPPHVVGCYASPGAPYIVVDRRRLRVVQDPSVEASYRLEYHKGWALTLDRGLKFIESGGAISIEPASPHGQFLFVSRELQISPAKPQFSLFDRDSAAIVYRWIGADCPM